MNQNNKKKDKAQAGSGFLAYLKDYFLFHPSWSRLFLGSMWMRLFAYWIDIFVASLLKEMIFSCVYLFVRADPPNFVERQLTYLIYIVYFILVTTLTQGQSLGKMICGLRILSREGDQPISFSAILLREGVMRYIHMALPGGFLLYFVGCVTSSHQTLSDMVADTAVFSERQVQELAAYQGGQVF